MNKKESRTRRARKTRARIKLLGVNRLCVYKTPRHIYAQIIAADNSGVVACASTLDKELKSQNINGGNVSAAVKVGKMIAEKAKKAGITQVAFDRSGFKYHGRIKALADSARENGMEF